MEHDCQKTHARIIEQNKETITVEVNEKVHVIPAKSFHISEDEYDWVCMSEEVFEMGYVETGPEIRCLFISIKF